MEEKSKRLSNESIKPAATSDNSLNPRLALREKYPNTEFFLLRIFPHLDFDTSFDTSYLSLP